MPTNVIRCARLALAGASAFWIVAGVQLLVVMLRTHLDPTATATGFIFAPALVHVLTGGLGERALASASRFLGALDVAAGVTWLGVLGFEALTQPEWSAFWQLEDTAPPRVVWAAMLILVGGLLVINRPPRRSHRAVA